MIQGIRQVEDYWVWFDENGQYQPGKFADRDAARNGCWITAKQADAINIGENRLITVPDTLWGMREWRWHELTP